MLLKPIIPVLEYIVFYDYIKNELCVNKDKPELHCDGKCYLAKQIAKAQEAEKERREKKQIPINTTVEFCEVITSYFNLFIATEQSQQTLEYKDTLYAYTSHSRLLRPPILVF
ncbi:hypothetical protein SAMN05216480_10255 [Pustulibacterium marinum]|uniref:Uncharacterized protein n=2 Tax=Pustulibacterium marinum TaxID=1224947 RepID=A0A1I7FN53_9FLAO|nr:hypothetical protein SAMN05216480_10255 [Pustulibacterium marinum]